MFRCQFSGEKSDPAVYRTDTRVERTNDGKEVLTTEKALVRAPEKPVRIIIARRPKEYVNYYLLRNEEGEVIIPYRREEKVTKGFEIVKELVIRAKHVAAVKAKYGILDEPTQVLGKRRTAADFLAQVAEAEAAGPESAVKLSEDDWKAIQANGTAPNATAKAHRAKHK